MTVVGGGRWQGLEEDADGAYSLRVPPWSTAAPGHYSLPVKFAVVLNEEPAHRYF